MNEMPPQEKPKYDNTGLIYANQSKRAAGANPKLPDIKGKMTVAGVQYWISGWSKRGKNGGTYYTLAFKPFDQDLRNNTNDGGQSLPREDDTFVPF